MGSVANRGRRTDFEGGPSDGDRSPVQTADGPHVSDDDVFKVLSNRRRRQVIEHLREGDGTATVGRLAEEIAAEENETTIQQLTSAERKSAYVSLYQNHLPVMDDANVIDYDENRKTVQLTEGVAELEPYLKDDTGSGYGRAPIAGVLTVATGVLLGGFQIGAFAAVSASIWTLVGIVGVVGMVCFETRDGSAD